MKIYLAGNVAVVKREKRNVTKYRTRLFSFFYITPNTIEHKVFEWLKFTLRESRVEGSPVSARERELDSLWNKRLHSYFHLYKTNGKLIKYTPKSKKRK